MDPTLIFKTVKTIVEKVQKENEADPNVETADKSVFDRLNEELGKIGKDENGAEEQQDGKKRSVFDRLKDLKKKGEKAIEEASTDTSSNDPMYGPTEAPEGFGDNMLGPQNAPESYKVEEEKSKIEELLPVDITLDGKPSNSMEDLQDRVGELRAKLLSLKEEYMEKRHELHLSYQEMKLDLQRELDGLKKQLSERKDLIKKKNPDKGKGGKKVKGYLKDAGNRLANARDNVKRRGGAKRINKKRDD